MSFLLVPVDDGREYTCQVAMRFDFVQLAGVNQPRDDSPILRSRIVPSEECILPL